DNSGRSQIKNEKIANQSDELSTYYLVHGNLNKTDRVLLSKHSNRLAPLPDGVEDAPAVYVGARLRFLAPPPPVNRSAR
ncbi:hypothetical protein O4G73_14270, partial [Erythrobacter sp. G21629-S1]|nr:hypothetical protein [Erythrobacter sp. G21629-S1]